MTTAEAAEIDNSGSPPAVAGNRRPALQWAGAAVAVVVGYLLLKTFLPAKLPLGVVAEGVVLGGLASFSAMGLVLVYRAVRAVNFAQAAMGGLAAAVAETLFTAHWSYWVATAVGLAVALAIGLVIELTVIRRLRRAPRLIVMVATIGVAQVLEAAAIGIGHFALTPQTTVTYSVPVHLTVNIDPFVFGSDSVLAVLCLPVVLGGLYFLFQRTNTGIAIRAVADSPERSRLLGLPVGRISALTWIIAGGLSGLAAMLGAPMTGYSPGLVSGPETLLPALAAAVLARMSSLPRAAFWAVALSVLQQAMLWSFHQQPYADVGMFVVILAALSLQRRRRDRSDDWDLGDFVAMREIRDVPARLRRLPSVRWLGWTTAVVLALAAGFAPVVVHPAQVILLAFVVVFVIAALSLVTLTGWAGQISLGQFGIVGVGAAVTGSLLVHHRAGLFACIFASGIIGAVVALVMGLPALRIPGPYLPVVTLAFAVAVSSFLLSSQYVPWLDPPSVPRGVLWHHIHLANPTVFYEVCLIVMAVVLYLTRNLRKSRVARVVMAVRDNAQGAESFGINAARTKLLAFVLSGAVAGAAGSLYVQASQGIGYSGFDPGTSLLIFSMVVIGGLGSTSGAVIGAVLVELASHFLPSGLALLVTGVGVLVIVLVIPEGLGGLVFAVRDAVVRSLAGRSENRATRNGLATTGRGSGNRRVSTLDMTGGAAGPLTQNAAMRLSALEQLESLPDRSMGGPAPTHTGHGEGKESVLVLERVSVTIGHTTVLSGIDLEVAEGDIVAVLGSNGGGKSTLLRVIAGLTAPETGSIRFAGEDITSWSPSRRVRHGIGAVLGGRAAFPSLTVAENLRLSGWVDEREGADRGVTEADLARIAELFPPLAQRMAVRAGVLSGGEQQMLTLAQALLCRPRLLLIDELTLGLSPGVVDQLLQAVRAIAASGVTVVLVEQSINVAASVSNWAIFMERGRIRFSGVTPELSAQPDTVREVLNRAADLAQERLAPSQPGASLTDQAGLKIVDVARLLAGDTGSGPDDQSSGSDQGQAGTGSALRVSGVSKSYVGVSALSDVTIDVAQGEIVGIIGANGSGKTTLLDLCSGYTAPDLGAVLLGGVDVTGMGPDRRTVNGLGRVFQNGRLFPNLTVAETLAVALEQHVPLRDPFAVAFNLSAVSEAEQAVTRKVADILGDFGLSSVADTFVGELSSGTRRIVELTCAVAHEPKVLLLDEPTAALSQRETDTFVELLQGLRAETGAAFVIVEHDVSLVSKVADRVVCLSLGSVVADGPTYEVLRSPAVLQAYLGFDGTGVSAGADDPGGEILPTGGGPT